MRRALSILFVLLFGLGPLAGHHRRRRRVAARLLPTSRRPSLRPFRQRRQQRNSSLRNLLHLTAPSHCPMFPKGNASPSPIAALGCSALRLTSCSPAPLNASGLAALTFGSIYLQIPTLRGPPTLSSAHSNSQNLPRRLAPRIRRESSHCFRREVAPHAFVTCPSFFSSLSPRRFSRTATVFATLHGVVHDPEHRPIANAQITLEAAESRFVLHGISAANGEFRIAQVPIGVYRLDVSAPGFASVSQSITVASGTNPVLHIPLPLPNSTESVVVRADRELPFH